MLLLLLSLHDIVTFISTFIVRFAAATTTAHALATAIAYHAIGTTESDDAAPDAAATALAAVVSESSAPVSCCRLSSL